MDLLFINISKIQNHYHIMRKSLIFIGFLFLGCIGCTNTTTEKAVESDPLPSWNEGATKQAILDFVQQVTDEQSEDYVAVPDRIAVFDNDGNLWSEQPAYFQLFFAMAATE